ncbi:hypothetical protein JNUCC32_31480 (plasmid) [Paenibacillus sp. JNUCC32]|uniref:hypothetical protein n=1 Tax=Paenibacillus sp. JNUCC32 TaxID=2777984 RepID=UPI001788702D|nr:hypothetical protein [Paenibacillus sp. JNUCC-32]QOT13719.1 hypothetical protein JNUCC32_31480 [Paenibacillus sp. JNUCC-32]
MSDVIMRDSDGNIIGTATLVEAVIEYDMSAKVSVSSVDTRSKPEDGADWDTLKMELIEGGLR